MVLLSPGDLPFYYLLIRERGRLMLVDFHGRVLCLSGYPESVSVPSAGAESWGAGQPSLGLPVPSPGSGHAPELEVSEVRDPGGISQVFL